jgi:hypothetical protein
LRIARAARGLPARIFFALPNAAGRLLAAFGRPIEVHGRRDPGNGFDRCEELVKAHFDTWAPGHMNSPSLLDTLLLLGESPSLILETGSSAWGTDSSRLFDSYVASFGGKFHTVDIRMEPMMKLRRGLSNQSTLCCDDSVRFLRRWVEDHPGERLDLVYLDSWDLDISNPLRSATHGLEELFAIAPALRDGSLLLIDDTPVDVDWFPPDDREAARSFQSAYGLVPGKGMLVDRYLEGRDDVTKVHHRYQVLYRFGTPTSGSAGAARPQ